LMFVPELFEKWKTICQQVMDRYPIDPVLVKVHREILHRFHG
jgi:hypothetical protein